MKSTLFAILLGLAGPNVVAGDALSTPFKSWVNAMLGWNAPGQAWGAGANLSRGHLMGSARYVFATEFCVACDDWASMHQAQLLAGGKLEVKAGFFDLMTGLTWETGNTRDRFGRHSYADFGLPLVAELHLTSRYIGLGLSLAANVNAHNPAAGIYLTVPVGFLR